MLADGPIVKGIVMHRTSRLPIRLAALAFSAAALAACASSPSDSEQLIGGTRVKNTGAALPAATLDGEIRQAQLARTNGDFAGAIRTLSQLMLVSPDDPRIVGEYGKVLVQQGRAKEAEDFLERAVILQPNDWTLYSALGVAYDQTGDSAKARTAYEHALILKPGEAVVLNNYAMSCMLAGNLAKARELLKQATASGSPDPKIARNLALVEGLAKEAAPANGVAASSPSAKSGASALPTPKSTVNPPAKRVVMQELPATPAAPQASGKATQAPRKLAAKAKKKDDIPSLRLASDTP